ncbi:hypothetical protein CDAR_74371 [Caerostris darwini]|uniref:Uncharacterized protein n=1 Tax=Caerostris darwini TaxID=1538125 RepID=A0AAV4UJP9_9ARAC|nr:hypothetical protein CDAR_74371 [Caerostris darwini]
MVLWRAHLYSASAVATLPIAIVKGGRTEIKRYHRKEEKRNVTGNLENTLVEFAYPQLKKLLEEECCRWFSGELISIPRVLLPLCPLAIVKGGRPEIKRYLSREEKSELCRYPNEQELFRGGSRSCRGFSGQLISIPRVMLPLYPLQLGKVAGQKLKDTSAKKKKGNRRFLKYSMVFWQTHLYSVSAVATLPIAIVKGRRPEIKRYLSKEEKRNVTRNLKNILVEFTNASTGETSGSKGWADC